MSGGFDLRSKPVGIISAAGRTEIWSWKLKKVQALVVKKVDNVYPPDKSLSTG